MLEDVKKQAETCLRELLDVAGLEAGDIVVVGCSTSEIMGRSLGSEPSKEAGLAVFSGIYPVLKERGLWLAAQCCEHLNRALVIEKEAAVRFGLPQAVVVPTPEAGGSWAARVYQEMKAPVIIENLDACKACAGLDIGETCVGMHLKTVAVMVRPSTPWIGKARVAMMRTRPKLIGGERAQYK